MWGVVAIFSRAKGSYVKRSKARTMYTRQTISVPFKGYVLRTTE